MALVMTHAPVRIRMEGLWRVEDVEQRSRGGRWSRRTPSAEVDAAVSGLLSLLEPIMIVFLGGVVGGMLVAMSLPIFDIINAVQ